MPSSTASQSDSDVQSVSSTVIYDQEPFSTFRSKVLKFVQSTIWTDATTDEITVDRLQGGGFNRIIGLKRSPLLTHQIDGLPTEATPSVEYILRIPRFDASRVDHDAAALQFVHSRSTIPAPRIIKFDETEHNDLGSPYMVQNRLRGISLIDVYPSLSHEDQCKVAREVGEVFRQMLAIHSSAAGLLVLPEGDKSLDATLQLASWEARAGAAPSDNAKDASSTIPFSEGPVDQGIVQLLTAIFQAQKADDLKLSIKGTAHYSSHLMDRFCIMVAELNENGLLKSLDSHQYCLAHLDLEPRNILIDPTLPTQTPIITGILDWDSAVLAPIFMACAPPMWIWCWLEDEDEDERMANDEPPTAEKRELKHIFEEAAGQVYLRFAYEPAFRLARRLVKFAIDGLRSNEDGKEAEEMLEEWNALMQSGSKMKEGSHEDHSVGQ